MLSFCLHLFSSRMTSFAASHRAILLLIGSLINSYVCRSTYVSSASLGRSTYLSRSKIAWELGREQAVGDSLGDRGDLCPVYVKYIIGTFRTLAKLLTNARAGRQFCITYFYNNGTVCPVLRPRGTWNHEN